MLTSGDSEYSTDPGSEEDVTRRASFFSKVNKNVKCQKQQHEEKKAEKTTELLKTEDFQIKFVNGSLT